MSSTNRPLSERPSHRQTYTRRGLSRPPRRPGIGRLGPSPDIAGRALPGLEECRNGDVTPTGRPFFVMGLVHRQPLNKFCDAARLSTKERLELFVAISQAVQHAHQKGIVHRDLKPANILVTMIDARPTPKIIDFGVAKATAGKLTDESLSTQFGAIVGTLEYMSPEHASFTGEDIDTRADIYSLGVSLYELLTGIRPIDAKRLNKAATHRDDPDHPGRGTLQAEHPALHGRSAPLDGRLAQIEPRKLMALLRGELDWVVMKCLEKHRERRYETASGLAHDIQRYLADEAVEARPPSAGYCFSKFVRRHKGQVIAASLMLLALLSGLGAVAGAQAAANKALSSKNQDLLSALGRQAIEACIRAVSEAFGGIHSDKKAVLIEGA